MLILLVFFLGLFLLGYNLGWSVFQYDELRLLQLTITSIIFIILVVKAKPNLTLTHVLFFFFILLSLLFRLYDFNIYTYQDLILLIVTIIVPYYLSIEFNQYSKIQLLNSILFFLVICATLPVLFIGLSIKDLFKDAVWYSWQMNAGNIRIYDSIVVPILFLAIYLRLKNYPHIFYMYPFIIFLITLGLWFDGARAALLSILIGLVIIFIFSKPHRKLILSTATVIFFSFFIYQLTYYFYNQIHDVDKSLNVIRTNSSGRWELWNYIYQQWTKQPWEGVGGNYLATTDYPVNHLHNFYLKLIFEWGILGFVLLCWILYQLKKVLSSCHVHIALKAGICAIAVDAFFSGNLVYPSSQISIAILIGLAFSQNQTHFKINKKINILSNIVIFLWSALYTYILVIYFSQDLLCWQCGSYSKDMAPGFWYYGNAEHLIHHSLIP